MRPRWFLDMSTVPPAILPASVDRSELIDVTRIGDAFRRYLDPSTGKEHVGAQYHEQYVAEMRALGDGP